MQTSKRGFKGHNFSEVTIIAILGLIMGGSVLSRPCNPAPPARPPAASS
jgi:hypothetical protein